MSIHVVCSWMVLLGDITNTALLTKNPKSHLYTEGFRGTTMHTRDFCGKKKEDTSHTWVRSRVAAYVEEKMRTNVNHVPWFCTMNQVPLVTHSSVVLYTPTQAHSCKSSLLKDDCTPASILEFKSTTHSLWLLTSRVKSTELAQNPTRQTTSWSTSLWLRCSSQASPQKTERGHVVSVTGEEFRTLLLRIYQSFVDVISSACKHWIITGVNSNTS